MHVGFIFCALFFDAHDKGCCIWCQLVAVFGRVTPIAVYDKNANTHANVRIRMVQLPATAAIEYVAACWVSGAGFFCPGVLLSGGGLLSGGLMPVPPSSMRIRTV